MWLCMRVLESRLRKGLEADWDLGGSTAQQRTQHVCWMILGTQLLVKHQFFRGRLLLALVASGKLCWGIGNQKCPSKFFFWYPYTLSVYDCDNMLWLHSINICMIMIDDARIQGSSFLPLFFLLLVADCWFNRALLVNTHVPATDTSTNENAFVRGGQRSSSEYDSSLSASCGSCHPFQGFTAKVRLFLGPLRTYAVHPSCTILPCSANDSNFQSWVIVQ